MFSGSTEPKIEAGFLRSGRRFRSGKRRKILEGRQNPNLFREREYEFESLPYEGAYDEEEEYSSIYEGEEDSEESTETPRLEHNYTTPRASLEVRSRASSPERVVSSDSASTANSAQGSSPSLY